MVKFQSIAASCSSFAATVFQHDFEVLDVDHVLRATGCSFHFDERRGWLTAGGCQFEFPLPAYSVEKLARTESGLPFKKIDLSERLRFNNRWSVDVGGLHKFNPKWR